MSYDNVTLSKTEGGQTPDEPLYIYFYSENMYFTSSSDDDDDDDDDDLLPVNSDDRYRPFFFGGSNYDSLFVRTVAFPVQVAYWIKEVIAPCGYSVPCQF